jgi:hypothetical protein
MLMSVLLQITSVILILVIQSTDTPSWLDQVPGIDECGSDKACYALQIGFRIGFATALVFAFHLVFSMLGGCFANKALNSFWVFKFMLLVGGSAVFLLIPNSFFTAWGGVADVILAWFLVIQMVWVIDFAFGWNDLWITNAAEDRSSGKSGTAWFVGLLVFSVLFLAGAYTWYGIMFSDFGDHNSNNTIMGINVGVSTALGVVSVFSPRGGILPASLVILYIAWLSWSTAISGEEDITTDARLGIGMTLAGLLIIYASYKSQLPQIASNSETGKEQSPRARSKSGNHATDATRAVAVGAHVEVTAPEQEAMESGQSVRKRESKPDAKPEVGSCRYIFFMNSMHLSAACYLMNLCLTWSNSPNGSEDMIAYWVQAVAAWVMMTLYAWTLLAPLACPNREF